MTKPATDAELATLRARMVEGEDPPIDKFTCDDCSERRTCQWVFDPYNTNGDCIASK